MSVNRPTVPPPGQPGRPQPDGRGAAVGHLGDPVPSAVVDRWYAAGRPGSPKPAVHRAAMERRADR